MSITNEDLTTGSISGDGTFDIIIQAAKAHLKEEFENGRITGKEYSEVYLGSMNAAMGQAVQFLLQRDSAANQALLIGKQIEKIDAEILLLGKQGLLVDKQIEKITAEIALVQQQTTNAATENTVLTNQANKLISEKALLDQKKMTEEAQISASVPVDEDSVIGRNKKLVLAQTDGFTRDAEQKAAKIVMDAWSVYATTDGAVPLPSEISIAPDGGIDDVLDVLKLGIGIASDNN